MNQKSGAMLFPSCFTAKSLFLLAVELFASRTPLTFGEIVARHRDATFEWNFPDN
jgi:hypothetical protein